MVRTNSCSWPKLQDVHEMEIPDEMSTQFTSHYPFGGRGIDHDFLLILCSPRFGCRGPDVGRHYISGYHHHHRR